MTLNDDILSIKASNQALTKTAESLVNRLTRIETRLTQLMVFQGMQTDGRKPITLRGGQSHEA